MIVVRVELRSAITGLTTELGRMHISNRGDEPNPNFGNYDVHTLRGRGIAALDRQAIQRDGTVLHYPRRALHVWNLVARALRAMNYGEDDGRAPQKSTNNPAD